MASKSVNVYYLNRARTHSGVAPAIASCGLFAGMAALLVARVLVGISEIHHHGVGI